MTGATVSVLAEFHEELREQWLHTADTFVTNAIRAWSSGYLDFSMRALSFLGSWKVLTPLVILSGIGLLRSHQTRSAALLWIGNGGALILGMLAKLHFARVRPDVEWALTHEESYSFPSGHALSGMVVAGTMIIFVSPLPVPSQSSDLRIDLCSDLCRSRRRQQDLSRSAFSQ